MKNLSLDTDSRGVATLTLQRPTRHNALDREFIDELHDTLQNSVDGTRVLVLTGAGSSFCAGADLDWMRASATLDAASNSADATALSALLEVLDRYPHPTIARVNGSAIGGGSGLVACCDIAVANDDARFGFSEVRLGLIPATISPYVIRAIGPRAARRLFLTGERFDAIEALHIGLVDDVCPENHLDRRVDQFVEALLAGGHEAQAATKRLIADVSAHPFDDTLRTDLADRLATVRAGAEAQEGLQAFLDKRAPSWR